MHERRGPVTVAIGKEFQPVIIPAQGGPDAESELVNLKIRPGDFLIGLVGGCIMIAPKGDIPCFIPLSDPVLSVLNSKAPVARRVLAAQGQMEFTQLPPEMILAVQNLIEGD